MQIKQHCKEYFKEIVLASSNANKLLEISAVAKTFGIKILSPAVVAEKLSLEPFKDPEETGSSYYENALIKAQACFDWCKLPSIGDDSGLEVSILNNAPGIFSARYAGVGASDKDKINKLLTEFQAALKTNKSLDRSARFRCQLVIVAKNSAICAAEGILEGEVLDSPIGTNGFGYDPIIKIHELKATLAEVTPDVIYTQGFRAKAAMSLFNKLMI